MYQDTTRAPPFESHFFGQWTKSKSDVKEIRAYLRMIMASGLGQYQYIPENANWYYNPVLGRITLTYEHPISHETFVVQAIPDSEAMALFMGTQEIYNIYYFVLPMNDSNLFNKLIP